MEQTTKDKIDEILKLYREGDCLQHIANKTVSAPKTVKKVLLNNGIDYTKLFWDKIQEKKEKALQLYKEGIDQTTIEKECNITRSDLRKWLKADDSVNYRSKSSQKILSGGKFNENAFDDLTNEEVQYWIGFLYADGHISSGKRGFSIEVGLKGSDYEHLVKFTKFLDLNRLPTIDKKNCAKIRIGSRIIWDKLKSLGFDNNKSKTANPPQELRNSRHFWRGVVDGDGCLSNACRSNYPYKSITLVGTLTTIYGFIEFINLNKEPIVASGKDLFQVHVYKEATKIAEVLYHNTKIYLDRKYEIYQEWLS